MHKILNTTLNDPNTKNKLLEFSLQLIHRKVEFSGSGLFVINRALLLGVDIMIFCSLRKWSPRTFCFFWSLEATAANEKNGFSKCDASANKLGLKLRQIGFVSNPLFVSYNRFSSTIGGCGTSCFPSISNDLPFSTQNAEYVRNYDHKPNGTAVDSTPHTKIRFDHGTNSISKNLTGQDILQMNVRPKPSSRSVKYTHENDFKIFPVAVNFVSIT